MHKILILTKNLEAGEKLEKQCSGSVKLVTELSIAIDWMAQRPIDMLFMSDDFSKDEYSRAGHALWTEQPSSQAFIFHSGEAPREGIAFYKVLGFHPLSGEALSKTLLAAERSPVPADGEAKPFPILVVEDLDSPRDIICIFIESLGFPEVRGCASASEALSLLEENPTHYGCVVTDLKMPNISGKELIEIVRSHDRLQHLPLVVLTAFGTLDMLIDCLRLGASGFLIKPPKKADMLRELSRAVRIAQKKETPRLASLQEAEYIRRLVEEQKVT